MKKKLKSCILASVVVCACLYVPFYIIVAFLWGPNTRKVLMDGSSLVDSIAPNIFDIFKDLKLVEKTTELDNTTTKNLNDSISSITNTSTNSTKFNATTVTTATIVTTTTTTVITTTTTTVINTSTTVKITTATVKTEITTVTTATSTITTTIITTVKEETTTDKTLNKEDPFKNGKLEENDFNTTSSKPKENLQPFCSTKNSIEEDDKVFNEMFSVSSIKMRTQNCENYWREFKSIFGVTATPSGGQDISQNITQLIGFVHKIEVEQDLKLLEILLLSYFDPDDGHCLILSSSVGELVRNATQSLVSCFQTKTNNKINILEQNLSDSFKMIPELECATKLLKNPNLTHVVFLGKQQFPAVSLVDLRRTISNHFPSREEKFGKIDAKLVAGPDLKWVSYRFNETEANCDYEISDFSSGIVLSRTFVRFLLKDVYKFVLTQWLQTNGSVDFRKWSEVNINFELPISDFKTFKSKNSIMSYLASKEPSFYLPSKSDNFLMLLCPQSQAKEEEYCLDNDCNENCIVKRKEHLRLFDAWYLICNNFGSK